MEIYLTHHGTKVSAKKGKLYIKLPTSEKRTFPINAVDSIIVFAKVSFSGNAIRKLLHLNIPTYFVTTTGKLLGTLQTFDIKNLPLRKKQYKFYFDEFNESKFYLAKYTVRAKIINSYRLMRRWLRARELKLNIEEIEDSYKTALYKLERTKMHDYEAIRGIEGFFAARYFSNMADLIPNTWKFYRRTKHPPTDPFNALLSFGYTLLFQRVYTFIVTKNLDPYFGFLHKIKYSNATLASDLMEEFRAPIIDSIALELVNKHKINPKFDFTKEQGKGYKMSRELIKKFITLLDKKLKRHYKTEHGELSYDDILIKKVNSFAKVIKGKAKNLYYFTIR